MFTSNYNVIKVLSQWNHPMFCMFRFLKLVYKINLHKIGIWLNTQKNLYILLFVCLSSCCFISYVQGFGGSVLLTFTLLTVPSFLDWWICAWHPFGESLITVSCFFCSFLSSPWSVPMTWMFYLFVVVL